ncbi:arylformamidase [Sediminibacillus massiliensis]|uniref:arylformamidase n=1 Tax=Sediminibacillus massiliensis TaxID=1926277 RepID=UPI0009885269|nr:arylformamidase [Sediminibacillus massiliensis]
MNDPKWIDISQPLHAGIAHWPGDTPFSYELTFSKEETGSVNIGKITTSLHTGTHVDAPFHFQNDGAKILDLDINVFIGPCLVINAAGHKQISKEFLQRHPLEGAQRILFKTVSNGTPDIFPDEVACLTIEAVDYLQEKEIVLIGVDVPSVDMLDSKNLPIHNQLHQHGIYILENIVLDNVASGAYELAALPLPIKGADGSPVRAAIRKLVNGERGVIG